MGMLCGSITGPAGDLGVLRKGSDRDFDIAVTLASRALRPPDGDGLPP